MAQKPTYIDALVVGAGFGGINATYRLIQLGLTVKCIDMASDVGGTWYWNRYPGAMSDTESYIYRFSWDKEDLQTYPWSNHYLYQPEIIKYLRHVADKYSLRKYMQFNTEMTAATWDEDLARWKVTCVTGDTFIAKYLINALGLLTKPNYPNIPGIESFAGTRVHTAQWPEDLELEGKRVGVIGNGSTGVQVMTAIAPRVGKLVSFQRHPQYSVPSGQGPVSPEYREKVNKNYDEIWKGVFSSITGFGFAESSVKTMSVSPEERKKAFQRVWDQGNGFRFMFGAFGDITTNEEANEEACKFIREKIGETVHDPKKAEILKPKQLYARRPLCDAGYYEIFNRANVDVVDIQATPIVRMTPQGVELSDGTVHELDVLVFATGFDAVEGSYLRLTITGRDEKSLHDHWRNGPTSYGAVACSGFPNMFLLLGPQGPFSNIPPAIEIEIDLIMSCIERAEQLAKNEGETVVVVEALEQAERDWVALCDKLTSASLFSKTPSWIFGVNVEGRQSSTKFYFGGLGSYVKWVKDTLAHNLRGFTFQAAPQKLRSQHYAKL
jgi:cation diffusion facilitator CzcD-associated flavoprotein CzcO